MQYYRNENHEILIVKNIKVGKIGQKRKASNKQKLNLLIKCENFRTCRLSTKRYFNIYEVQAPKI